MGPRFEINKTWDPIRYTEFLRLFIWKNDINNSHFKVRIMGKIKSDACFGYKVKM